MTPAAERVGWYAWYVAALLAIAYLLSFIDRVVISLLIAPIQRDLGVSDTQVSLLMGFAFVVFYTLFGLPIGRLVDVMSRRTIIVIGVFTWSVATSLCGLAQSFWQLLAARMLVGVGEASLSPSAYSLLADYFPPHRLSLAMSVYNLGLFGGAGTALILAGSVMSAIRGADSVVVPLLGELRPWQLVFVVIGLPGVLVAAAVLTIKEPQRRHGILAPQPGVVAARGGVPLHETWSFLKLNSRTFVGLMGAVSLSSLFGYGLNAWAPSFFIRTHGWDEATIGLVYGSVVLFSGLAGVASGGLWTDGCERRGWPDAKIRSLILGYSIMLVFSLIGPLMPSAGLALLFLGLGNFGFSFPVGGAVAALQTVTPNQMRGQISALYLFVINVIGLGFGPLSMALLTEHVFEDRAALRYSISVVAGLALPLAIGLLISCLRAFRESSARAGAWSGSGAVAA